MAYSDDEKATVLALYYANNGNMTATVKGTRVSKRTIQVWVKEYELSPDGATVRRKVATKKRAIGSKVEELLHICLDEALLNRDVKDFSNSELVRWIGILSDKNLALAQEDDLDEIREGIDELRDLIESDE